MITDEKVIDIAMKYGYDSPDSFTKAFTVIANAKTFSYEGAKEVAPQFWQEHYQAGMGKYICGEYGINIDLEMNQENFEYLIADPYNLQKDVPEGLVTSTIVRFGFL